MSWFHDDGGLYGGDGGWSSGSSKPEIFYAIDKNDVEGIDKYFKYWNIENNKNKPGLSYAVAKGNKDIIEYLILTGADVNKDYISQIHGYDEPLIEAVEKGDKEIIDLLLDNGAYIDIHSKNKSKTPLMVAVQINNPDIFAYLLEKGADYSILDIAGNDIIDYIKGDEKFLSILEKFLQKNKINSQKQHLKKIKEYFDNNDQEGFIDYYKKNNIDPNLQIEYEYKGPYRNGLKQVSLLEHCSFLGWEDAINCLISSKNQYSNLNEVSYIILDKFDEETAKEMIYNILKTGGNPDSINLEKAVKEIKDEDFLIELIKLKSSLVGDSIPIIAIRLNKQKVVMFILENKKYKNNFKNYYTFASNTIYELFCEAMLNKNIDVCEYLIENNLVELNNCLEKMLSYFYNNQGKTPFIFNAVKILVDAGADINIKNNRYGTIIRQLLSYMKTKGNGFSTDKYADLICYLAENNIKIDEMTKENLINYSRYFDKDSLDKLKKYFPFLCYNNTNKNNNRNNIFRRRFR